MALEIQMDNPIGSRKRNQNKDIATQITTEIKHLSKALVSIGKKP